MTKKPLPSIARSVGWPVFSMLPCVKIVPTRPMRTPRPILPALPPPPCAESRSANSVRLPLKPTVFTLAMLLPITLSEAPVAMRPLRAVESAPKMAMTLLLFSSACRRVLLHLAHVGQREAAIADQKDRRVTGQIDAGHHPSAARRDARRRAGAVAGHELHLVRAVGEVRRVG